MPSISKKKRSRISEQILSYLYNTSPEASFTVKIAEEIIRDEEFFRFGGGLERTPINTACYIL